MAIVGLGRAARAHLASLERLSHRVEIAACFSPSALRRGAFAQVHAHRVVDDLDDILADPKIDTVLVLTPPKTHLDLVRRCASSGKHVLLEKPVDVSLDRAKLVVGTMSDAGLRLGVVLQQRFRASVMQLRPLLAAGELGELVSASATMRWWRGPEYYAEAGRGTSARDGGGVLLTQAIHTLDLLLLLGGPIAEVTAMTGTSPRRAIDTEDMAAAAVRFRNGAVGSIDVTTTAFPGFDERIELVCEGATAVLSGQHLAVHFRDGRRVEAPEGPLPSRVAAHQALIEAFLDALDAGRDPEPSGRDALAVHGLIDAMLTSARTQIVVRLS
jgi:UDP-N-acetyl-2-amino-2-deoxyglucuronate dehydrogenase